MIEDRRDLFVRLRESLPSDAPFLMSGDIEAQARAALTLVVDPVLERWPRLVLTAWSLDPSTCPNCGTLSTSTRTPYCSDHCREEAGFVRQFRTGLGLGWILEPEKQVALGQTLWHLLGGGRPLRQQIAPTRAREAAFKRESGRCQVCGAPATTIDHLGSGCNRPINLRAVCDNCCLDRPFFEPRIVERPAFSVAVSAIGARVGSPGALRCCDDAENWDWRDYLAARNGVRGTV